MATTFSSFSNILPDPINKIDSAGVSNPAGSAGPGFAKVKFRSSNEVQVSRTISGRGVTASPGYHVWEFDINYNPMTRNEFEPVSTFLESRQGRLNPFFVILPQHRLPQNALFSAYAQANTITTAATPAGSTTLLISGTGMTQATAGNPSPGDFINIVDPTNINHVKAYKVIRVETDTYYRTGTTAPSSTQRRLHLQPPLTRAVSSTATVRFADPRFRVIQKTDTVEYDLDAENLYQFSLSLEELLP
jgi:hypothetical protein